MDRGVIFYLILLLSVAAVSHGKVDITLEGRDGGFFLRPLQQNQQAEEEEVQRFTLLHSGAPATLRAQYGPFVARQTVRPRRPSAAANDTTSGDARVEALWEYSGDVTARIVTKEVRRDRPVLRVLFHSARASDPKRRTPDPPTTSDKQQQLPPPDSPLCVVLYVHHREQHLMAACSPGRDGVCLAQATLPVAWWPPLESPAWRSPKTQRTWVRVEYAVLREGSLDCSDDPAALPVNVPPGLPSVYLEDVPLSAGHGSYEEVKSDDVVRILVPQGPVYPKSKVYVPVYLQPNPIYPPYVFVIRARVKSGLRILGAQVSPPSQWSITVELNPRQTVATVTAYVKDTSTKAPQGELDMSVQEVFTWLFEVEEGASYNDNGRITWQLRYMLDSSMAEQYDFDDDNAKITSRLDIQKDDVQAVLPIAKSTQLLNTAVLNGRQVSQPMKVFVVSQAGKVGDVTLQSSCHAADESILKVSPSCTSVYLDGSEIRGSQNASILVKYGTYTGQAHFLVWMPELPLTIRISDTKLSQIKGWRTPHLQRGKPVYLGSQSSKSSSLKSTFATSSVTKSDRWLDREDFDIVCRLRYQQGNIDVYTRFFSVDHNSGRESYLLSRKTEIKITDLVAPFLRVADMRIANLQGTTVRGMQSGRTEVQVLSPITGRVSGAKEVRVGTDRETITHLEVTVISGLQMTVTPDDTLSGVFVSQTNVNHKLTSQYQEGLLDIKLYFSDGTSALLADITDTDYHLSVDTFDSGVVAFAPMSGLPHPRVIAIGKGKGDLLHVTLELAERCQKRRSQPLAMAYAYVDVDFSASNPNKAVLNDVRVKSPKNPPKRTEEGGDIGDAYMNSNDASSILYRDAISHRGKSHYHEPAVQARQNLVHPSDLTPLEIGMYALLGVFCLAILVFLVSCSVFAVRYRRKQDPPEVTAAVGESVAHAHDWVWLGKATLERNSVNTRCSQTLVPMADFNGNHQADAGGTGKVQRREKKARPSNAVNRSSNVSFPGSEISIRITTNPQELREDEIAMLEKSTSTHNHPSGSATVSRDVKRVRIVTNPVPPPLPPGNNPLKLFPPHPPPPVPPHRNFPPAVPPHQRHFRLRGGSDAEWESVAQGMNYDQLIEYFENLKESNA